MTRGMVAAAILAVLMIFVAIVSARSSEPVDVALVLAVDASGSISAEDRVLQREGYAAAIASPEVAQAIRMGRTGRIAITVFEWGAESEQVTLIPWTIVDGPDSGARVAAALRDAPVLPMASTSISAALVHAGKLLEVAPPAARRVVDVSGDGSDTYGPAGVREARDALLRAGVTINGLPILGDQAAGVVDLTAYYEDTVIGGEGAFVIPARGFEDFPRAVRIKLVAEVAAIDPRPSRLAGR